MNFKGLERLKELGHKLVKPLIPQGIILLYHRIDHHSEPQLLTVTPGHFEEHLKVVESIGIPTRLLDLPDKVAGNAKKKPYIAITFDDGYADNFSLAKPVLESMNIPASVFVAAGKVDEDTEFWWDDLDRILLHKKTLPSKLELEISGKHYAWHFPKDQLPDKCSEHWNVLMHNKRRPAQKAYIDLTHIVRRMIPAERDQVIAQIAQWAGLPAKGRSAHLAMTRAEVLALSQSRVIDIGAHTMGHPVLSAMDTAEQIRQIKQSKDVLESWIKTPVDAFSYPFGRIEDYDSDSVRIVKEAGFACACSNYPRVVTRFSDPFQLPRFVVRDWPGKEFARHLRSFLKC